MEIDAGYSYATQRLGTDRWPTDVLHIELTTAFSCEGEMH
jgi:hypothetical protein